MIKTQKLVPDVYYRRSRDFQLLGRTFDFIFNYIKLNSENIYNSPYSDDFDNKLIDLTSTTLGFKQTHEYNTEQLSALCSIFAIALKNKGNIQSINYVLNLLGNVENTTEKFTVEFNSTDPYMLDIYVPSKIDDTNLLEDVLNYIIPAGISYRILKQALVGSTPIVEEYDLDYMKNVKITVKHVTTTGQALEIDNNTPAVQRSDADVGRIDNIHIVGDVQKVNHIEERQYIDGEENPEPVQGPDVLPKNYDKDEE